MSAVGLTTDQLERFDRDGFLVLPSVLDDRDLEPIWSEYAEALDEGAQELFARGDISSTFAHLPFGDRYLAILAENPDIYYYLGISVPLDYELLEPHLVRAHSGPALFSLISNPKILDVVESVLGPEIASNPVQQVRLKAPQRMLSGEMATYSNVGATTWHQDFGAVMDEAAETDMLTVWVAMIDTTVEMGCLNIMPGSHRDWDLTLHCPGKENPAENYIPQALLDRHGVEPVPVPVPKGTLVLLTKFTEHGALANESDRLRWSFDLRYQLPGQPTGRPAFPTFVLRSASLPTADYDDYRRGWEETRATVMAGYDGTVYEQNRWLKNRDNPVCA